MIEVRHRFVTFTPPVSGAYLIGDFTDWDENPLAVTEPVTIEFPEGAYVEYAFMDSNMKPLADLTNLCKPRNPWYEYHRCITLPSCAFKTPPRPKKFRGAVREYRIDSKVFASQRT